MFVILSRLKKKGKYSLVFFLWICYDSYEKKDKTFKTKVREPMQMDLTRGGITRPMLLFAGPMIAGNLLQQCYNIADTLIVGRALGASALASVGFSFTLMTFLTSVLLGLCMGSGALWSMLYGAEREEELKRCLFASFVFIGAVAVLLNVGVLALLEPVMTLLRIPAGAWDETRAYLRVVLLGVCFTFLYNYFACLLRSVGNSVAPLAFLAVSTVLNIGLDLWFVLGLGWGVAGAAGATVLAQGCSALWVLKFLTGRRALLRLRWNTLRLQAARVRRILALGTSGFVMSMTNSLVQVVCNATLQWYGGDLYVSVMTVINSVREVVSMPVTGLTNGAQPVLGYNYGAREYRRVRQGIRFTAAITVIYSALIWFLTLSLPGLLIRIFNDDAELLQAGVPAFRIYFCMFFVMSLQMAGQSVFVALGRSRNAIFFSLLRKAVVNAPLTVILAAWMGTNGVFTAEAVSQLIGGLACFITMYITVYRPLGRLEDGREALRVSRH